MFNIYIKRAAELYGVTHTRAIYEKAIEVLTDDQARWIFFEKFVVASVLSNVDILYQTCEVKTSGSDRSRTCNLSLQSWTHYTVSTKDYITKFHPVQYISYLDNIHLFTILPFVAGRCVWGLLIWRGNWVRLTERERCMLTVHRCVIPG